MILIVVYSILYIITSLINTFGEKINQIFFSYDNYFLLLVYINIFFPINVLVFLSKYKIKELIELKKYIIKFSFPAILYTIESVVLYWALINVPLSIYIIGRTSSSFFNVPFSLWYLHKNVNIIYYFGLLILPISYVLLAIDYSNINTTSTTIVSIIIILLSGLSTATYGNVIEKDFISIAENEKIKFVLFYQIIANMYGFLIVLPIALTLTIKNNLFTTDIIPNILYSCVGISFQIYFFFRIIISGYKKINANQILSSLDIFRRVIANILAYSILDEHYNILVIFANLCMFTSSILFLCSNIKKKKVIEYVELREIK